MVARAANCRRLQIQTDKPVVDVARDAQFCVDTCPQLDRHPSTIAHAYSNPIALQFQKPTQLLYNFYTTVYTHDLFHTVYRAAVLQLLGPRPPAEPISDQRTFTLTVRSFATVKDH